MAVSPIIPPARNDIRISDAQYRRAVSEAVLNKFGASINFINNRIIDRYSFNMGGYFRATSLAQYTFESVYLKNVTNLSYYTMKIDSSGTGINSFNIRVIDEAGTELGNLFTTPPSIAESSLANSLIGYDVKNAAELRKVTTASYNVGVIDPAYTTSIPAGYELKPYIVSGGSGALNLSINLGLEAQS